MKKNCRRSRSLVRRSASRSRSIGKKVVLSEIPTEKTEGLQSLNQLFDFLKDHDNKNFENLPFSKGEETDELLFDLIKNNTEWKRGDTIKWIERVAQETMKSIWKDLENREYSLNVTDIIESLAFKPSIGLFRDIVSTKDAYLRGEIKPKQSKMPKNYTVCSVFTFVRKSLVTMNQMNYCHGHRGLALVNGLRHNCRTCRVFNLLAFKETGKDQNQV